MTKGYVMMVEDSASDYQRTRAHLIANGYTVGPFIDNYESAILNLKIVQPNFILLDIDLASAQSGLDLAEHVVYNYRIPIIFVSMQYRYEVLKQASRYSSLFVTKLDDGYLQQLSIQLDMCSLMKGQMALAREDQLQVLPLFTNKVGGTGKSLDARTQRKLIIDKREIFYLETDVHKRNYRRVICKNGMAYNTSLTLRAMIHILGDGYRKIKKDTVLNFNYFESFIDSKTIMACGKKFSLGARYAQDIESYLAETGRQ
jgi:CheY-like chemotaxis protein